MSSSAAAAVDDGALARYASGECSLGELAHVLGLSRRRARAELGRCGIAVRSPGRPAGSSALARVLTERFLRLEHVEHGRSVGDLAADLGCTPKTVRRYLDEHGIDRPVDPVVPALLADPRRQRDLTGTGLTAADLWDLYVVRGCSTTAIAISAGCAASTVARDLRRHGIPLRRPGGSPPSAVRRRARQATIRLGVIAADT
jgi:hypothetical protein